MTRKVDDLSEEEAALVERTMLKRLRARRHYHKHREKINERRREQYGRESKIVRQLEKDGLEQ